MAGAEHPAYLSPPSLSLRAAAVSPADYGQGRGAPPPVFAAPALLDVEGVPRGLRGTDGTAEHAVAAARPAHGAAAPGAGLAAVEGLSAGAAGGPGPRGPRRRPPRRRSFESLPRPLGQIHEARRGHRGASGRAENAKTKVPLHLFTKSAMATNAVAMTWCGDERGVVVTWCGGDVVWW